MCAEEVIHMIAELCRKHSAKEAILFGSRVKGTSRERSDIDIAVAGADDFDLLSEEIDDLPTLYTVDVVNLDKCKNKQLLEDIRQYGRKIYETV